MRARVQGKRIGGLVRYSTAAFAAAMFALAAGPGASAGQDWTEWQLSPAPVQVAQAGSNDLLLQGGGGQQGGDSLLQDGGAPSGEDLLKGPIEQQLDTGAVEEAPAAEAAGAAAGEAHTALFAESKYPSATTCGTCHPRQFEQWAVSQHAYAQLSPVYMAFQNFINDNVNGTNGDFCIRCHNQVGMNQNESPQISNLERHPTSREGITCVVCHRVENIYNKASGRIALVEGDLLTPVYGPKGNQELERVLANPTEYRVVTDPDKPGRKIHREVIKFAPISSSTFCGTCHDVTLLNGFRLEEAFSEYRDSPAAAKGITCQDCHMGKVQGIPSGYDHGPAAVVGGVPTEPRKLTNHVFAGPDYSVVHPGVFPHNADAQKLATLAEWLQFDYEAGWGTDAFEDKVAPDTQFPERWQSVDSRYDAREILDDQFKRLEDVRELRLEVLRNGYALAEVVTEQASRDGLRFRAGIRNITEGHNTPTGFTGERLVWLAVTVRDSTGKVIYTSGDVDPNGDVRDNESAYVHTGKVPLDQDLLTLQSRFLVQSVRGGERERTVTIPYSTTALPFLRPTRLSLILTGESTVERNHRKGIEPLGSRWGTYEVGPDKLTGNGPYTATFELLGQMVPVNLITTIQTVGFDYGLSPRQVGDRVVAGKEVIAKKVVTFEVDKQVSQVTDQ